ncbi:MAG: hypothetical protein WBP45_02255 [Daejeonella sp.]
MLVKTIMQVCLVTILSAGTCLGQSAKMAMNGAGSPAELLNRSIAAVEKGDLDAFREFYLIKSDRDKKEVEALINLMKLEPRIKQFRDAGYKKFGDDFYEVLDKVHYELDLGLECMPDFKTANPKELKIQAMFGDTTVSKRTRQKDILGEPAMAAGFGMIKRSGRWYYVIADKREILYIAMNALVSKAEYLLAEAKTADDLTKKVSALRDLFNDYYDN